MFTTPLSSAPGDLVSPALAGQVGQSGPLSGLDPQQPYSPAAPLTRPPGLDPDGPTFPSPRKLVAEGLDPTEVGTQRRALQQEGTTALVRTVDATSEYSQQVCMFMWQMWEGHTELSGVLWDTRHTGVELDPERARS